MRQESKFRQDATIKHAEAPQNDLERLLERGTSPAGTTSERRSTEGSKTPLKEQDVCSCDIHITLGLSVQLAC